MPWQIMKAEERDRNVLRFSVRSTTLYWIIRRYMSEGSNLPTVCSENRYHQVTSRLEVDVIYLQQLISNRIIDIVYWPLYLVNI